MDDSAPLSEEVKNSTYKELIDILIRSVENGSLTDEGADDASAYILSRIDTLPNQDYLEAFLEVLAERWHCFQPILISIEKEASTHEDEQKMDKIKGEIQQISQTN